MNLTSQLTALREETRGLNRGERAVHCCDLAKQLEKAGEYEAAREALGEFWSERDGSPVLDQLDEATKAQVVLRVGALSGWLGSTDQAARSQEIANNLIGGTTPAARNGGSRGARRSSALLLARRCL